MGVMAWARARGVGASRRWRVAAMASRRWRGGRRYAIEQAATPPTLQAIKRTSRRRRRREEKNKDAANALLVQPPEDLDDRESGRRHGIAKVAARRADGADDRDRAFPRRTS